MTRQGTITGQEAFLRNIASRLGRAKPADRAPERTEIGVPDHYRQIERSRPEQVGLFVDQWTALGGRVWIVPREQAQTGIEAILRDLKEEFGWQRAIRFDDEKLDALQIDGCLAAQQVRVIPWKAGETLIQDAERCDVGIVWADYAIANTGTLAVLARGGRGRSVSLLPDCMLAVFRADQLVTRMGEMFAGIRAGHPGMEDLPSSINLITGPSRSADIENDLTIGVHGPGKVFAVIID